jgi:hypothetical protein
MATNWNVAIEPQARDMLINALVQVTERRMQEIREKAHSGTSAKYRLDCQASINRFDSAKREFVELAQSAVSYEDVRQGVKNWLGDTSEKSAVASDVYMLMRAGLNSY